MIYTTFTIDVEEISSGAAADELVIELEKFISAMISRSRSHKDLAIEVALEEPLIYYPEGLHLELEIMSMLQTNFMILLTGTYLLQTFLSNKATLML